VQAEKSLNSMRFSSSSKLRGYFMEVVGVVVGIVADGDRFLVERRSWDEDVDPGIVCLPAGHVEPSESLEDALKSEMMEELGIQIKEWKFVCMNFYVASNEEKQNAHCYLITEYEGTPTCKTAQGIFWEDNIENLTLEVDRKTISKMKEIYN
jgi:8-oxo-dGTP pyrophosphatase MutT (NUDIX family)